MDEYLELKKESREIRKRVFELNERTGLKHYGGSFSCVEILVALYKKVMKEEDKFILSKGHSAPPYYLLLQDRGFNPALSGHPDIDPKNGIYCTTGSLGHGLPFGLGMALSRKILDQKGKIFVLMSDGEFQEGITWESLLHGAKYGLDNLTAILDYNKIQSSDHVENILPLGDLEDKVRSFGWSVSRVDGHSFPQLIPSLEHEIKNSPRLIIADTIKGKGVSFMEGSWLWHSESPSKKQVIDALEELNR